MSLIQKANDKLNHILSTEEVKQDIENFNSNVISIFTPVIEDSLTQALENYQFSLNDLQLGNVVNEYMQFITGKADPLGFLMGEFDHMITAMEGTKLIMDVGSKLKPENFPKEYRDALGLAALWHDIGHIGMTPGTKVNKVGSLEDFFLRNNGKVGGDKYNGIFIKNLAYAAIGSKNKLYEAVIDAVSNSSGKHKLPEGVWNKTQWVTAMRMADNYSTQCGSQPSGQNIQEEFRHNYLTFLWAVDAFKYKISEGKEGEDPVKIATRFAKRNGFMKKLANGQIKDVFKDQILKRKGIDMQVEYPGMIDAMEKAGGFQPAKYRNLASASAAMRIAYTGKMLELIPEFKEAGFKISYR